MPGWSLIFFCPTELAKQVVYVSNGDGVATLEGGLRHTQCLTGAESRKEQRFHTRGAIFLRCRHARVLLLLSACPCCQSSDAGQWKVVRTRYSLP